MGQFTKWVKIEAYYWQGGRCAACGMELFVKGERIEALIDREGAEGHHIVPAAIGGADSVENCALVCRSCHASSHEGGRYRREDSKKLYADLSGGYAKKLAALVPHYRFYGGRRA